MQSAAGTMHSRAARARGARGVGVGAAPMEPRAAAPRRGAAVAAGAKKAPGEAPRVAMCASPARTGGGLGLTHHAAAGARSAGVTGAVGQEFLKVRRGGTRTAGRTRPNKKAPTNKRTLPPPVGHGARPPVC